MTEAMRILLAVPSMGEGGTGARPLAGFTDAATAVCFENETPNVGEATEPLIAGEVMIMDSRRACRHH